MKIKTVFCGTPDFSLPSLEVLFRHPQIDLYKVITMPARPSGRGLKLTLPPVAEFCQQNKIELFQTSNLNKELSLIAELKANSIDLIIVIAFAQIIKPEVLNIPRIGCFNIHASLLPKYRGAAPIQYALLNGDTQTGISIQKMANKLDAGDVVLGQNLSIDSSDDYPMLYTKLKNQAAELLNVFLEKAQNDTISYLPQDENLATYSPSINKEQGLLNFYKMNYQQIHNAFRALRPWPGIYCYINGQRLIIHQIEKIDYPLSVGEIKTIDGIFAIGCTDGSLRLSSIQWQGKKTLRDEEFIRGMQNNKQALQLTGGPE